MQFARTGEVDDLRQMLRQKRFRKEVNRLDDHGMAPLHYAARYNQLDVMRLLVERGKAGKASLNCTRDYRF